MSRHGKYARRFGWLLLLIALVSLMGYALYWAVDSGKLTRNLQPVDDTRYEKEIAAAAARYGIRVELVRALIRRESRFVADAVGSKGEIGLMQILPGGAAAEWARVNKQQAPSEYELFDVETNLNIGCWYLARALRRWKDYRHGTELALAEYNAGATNAHRWKPRNRDGKVIPRITFPGTKEYVTVIMRYYRQELEKNTLR